MEIAPRLQSRFGAHLDQNRYLDMSRRRYEQRVAALELRVQQLEQLVTTLLDKPAIETREQGESTRTHDRPTSEEFVSLSAFARHHNVAEATVQTHMGMGLLPVEQGGWMDADGMEVHWPLMR